MITRMLGFGCCATAAKGECTTASATTMAGTSFHCMSSLPLPAALKSTSVGCSQLYLLGLSVWVRIGSIGWRVISRVSVGPVVGRDSRTVPIGSPCRAPCDAGEGQRRERHADDVDEDRGR